MDRGPLPLRTIDDVATLKALSDPTRLAILRVMMAGAYLEPRILSVKELAEELGEPQTKLYRHVKQLEAQGLIEVAQTRIVSGIVEQRYRAGQIDLVIDPDLVTKADPDDQGSMIAAMFDAIRNELVAGLRSGRLRTRDDPLSQESRLPTLFGSWEQTIPLSQAREFQDRLSALLDEIGNAKRHDDGIPIVVLATMYSPVEPPGGRGAATPPT